MSTKYQVWYYADPQRPTDGPDDLGTFDSLAEAKKVLRDALGKRRLHPFFWPATMTDDTVLACAASAADDSAFGQIDAID